MASTFKALSALLSYPTAELKDAAESIREIVFAEELAPRWALDRLDRLIGEIESVDLY